MLAIEHDRTSVANYLLDKYPQIDLESKDGKDGNSALHIACLKGNNEVAERIFKDRPKLCLKQNYLGQTPFHIAASKRNLQIIQLFSEFK